MCNCTHEEKIIYSTQNGCYGNQSHPFEVLIDTDSSSSFTKRDFTFKQAHLVSFCLFCAVNESFDS